MEIWSNDIHQRDKAHLIGHGQGVIGIVCLCGGDEKHRSKSEIANKEHIAVIKKETPC
ncbi:MAG: hypothetical protein ACJAYN_000209 [Bermanella sp.]|jgi:hypothetical protein